MDGLPWNRGLPALIAYMPKSIACDDHALPALLAGKGVGLIAEAAASTQCANEAGKQPVTKC
ncbi:MAG TPA: hypothetical protein DIW43_09175 [Spongiibacteraceae bacterium]|nr:hypothetical protein [Spongiibacteraceae bacterium]HCS27616.1 hypothetical protein [Spongiibacteraceae bacterium]